MADRLLDHVLFSIELRAGSSWGFAWELERLFRLGGPLGVLSDTTKRRVRKHLRSFERGEARRCVTLFERHMEPEAFLDLMGSPAFLEDYESWGLKKGVIEALAEGQGGKAAGAKARRILKAQRRRPPTIQVPYNRDGYIRVTREALYELVWSKPMLRASKEFGLSDNGLRKICKKLAVPTPPRGYWAGGRPRKRKTRLPAPKQGWPVEAWLRRSGDLPV